ncbi:MAG: hypothetical protein IJI92_05190 [Erysipelotrichaceae bacterium]|nr:hypothetical protein [Erysipelotrichaceae bacterium]
MRGINERFINDLTNGELSFFLKEVKNRREDLSLEIRGGYINIYYRGGNLLKITQKRNGYDFRFDARYCLNKKDDSNYEKISSLDNSSTEEYIRMFPLLEKEMESWFAVHPKPERQYQHYLLLNNPSVIDIEYQVAGRMRFDMLMVEDGHLTVVENKYGLASISGSAGLAKHYRDICDVLDDPVLKKEMYASIRSIISNKKSLGLLKDESISLDSDRPEILFLLADYNMRSRSLSNEMSMTENRYPARIIYMSADEYIIDPAKEADLFTNENGERKKWIISSLSVNIFIL